LWLLPGIGLLTCGTANAGVDYIAACLLIVTCYI